MVMPAHREHAEQVHPEPQGADEQQLARVHLWWIQPNRRRVSVFDGACLAVEVRTDVQALDRLEYDEERDQDEEDAVGESGERLDAPVAVGEVEVSAARIVRLSEGRVPVCEPLVGRPACHDARDEAYANCHAVEGHVDG